MDKKYVTVEVELPQWLCNEADRAGLELSDVLCESIRRELFLKNNAFEQEDCDELELRIPKLLYHELTIAARREGVRLDQYVLYKLSQ